MPAAGTDKAQTNTPNNNDAFTAMTPCQDELLDPAPHSDEE
jgi:hypothetical protein